MYIYYDPLAISVRVCVCERERSSEQMAFITSFIINDNLIDLVIHIVRVVLYRIVLEIKKKEEKEKENKEKGKYLNVSNLARHINCFHNLLIIALIGLFLFRWLLG